MSEISQRLPPVVTTNPVHPNAKTTTHITNGTTTTKTNITSPVCRNCKTQTTPLWRRDETGQVLCNACGLFLKLHGRPRPISLKTDTIKSRNRIKQPNSAKSSVPNTPELKSKDSQPQMQQLNTTQLMKSGKKSPKTHKAKKSVDGSLTPLLPARGNSANTSGSSSSGGAAAVAAAAALVGGHQSFGSQSGHHYTGNSGTLGSIPHHVVQPLHYPSSTPTQFAPGLQRITSPLLLSNSSSISNARSSSMTNKNIHNSKTPLTAAQAAAGALENMSHELGPSASFKVGCGPIKDFSLIKKEESSKQLPRISSPSFGPQFSLNKEKEHSSSNESTTSLPPLVRGSSGVQPNQLPTFQSNFPVKDSETEKSSSKNMNNNNDNNNTNNDNINQNQNTNSDQKQNISNNSDNHNNNHNNQNNNQDNRNDPNNNNSFKEQNHEITVLKTRISELELVNDLYRTRIMELEAMEQAARLRENSMRKRLNEVLHLHEGGGHVSGVSSVGSSIDSSSQHVQQQTPNSSQQFGSRYSLPPIQGIKREIEGNDTSNKKSKLDAQ